MKKEIKEKFYEVRDGVIKKITEIVKSIGGELYIPLNGEYVRPVMLKDPIHNEDSFKLNQIHIDGNGLCFFASSNDNNCHFTDDEVSLDVLIDILDFIDSNDVNEMNRRMTTVIRIAIIDHETHELHIEDVTEDDLAKYNGVEEDYIKDNFTFEGEWSWDYIVNSMYYSKNYKDGICINDLEDACDYLL